MRFKPKYCIYLFPILAWGIVYFGFSFDGLYGQDAYEYLRYTESLKAFLLNGTPPGDYFWGVYYPLFGSFLSLIISNTVLALQLISLLSLIVATLYTDKIIRLIYPKEATGFIPFLFFMLSPIVLVHSFLVMSDLLACCFSTATVYFLLLFTKTAKTRHMIAGAILASFALFTRYAAFVIIAPFIVPGLITLIKNKKMLLLFYSFILLFLIAMPHLWIRSQNSLQFLSHQWIQSWEFTNLFRSDFVTADGASHNHFINLIYVCFPFVHPVFMVMGVVVLLAALGKGNFQLTNDRKLILITIIFYAVFLGGIPFQNKRFLLLSFPLVVVFLFPIIYQLTAPPKYKTGILLSVALFQLGLTLYFAIPFYQRNLLEKQIVAVMKPYQNKTLYVFDIDIALQGRKLHFNYKNLFLEKYTGFEENALVLINEKQIETQWQGKNPAENLLELKHHYQLHLVQNLPENWKLYQIQSHIK